ncbi:VOC family protein [Paraferrimonas haliotis]|uniref:Glyoxalase n=1 Tax=Paraferrimonas haliotis TaxID=2013866 RepID=A0AA37TQ48_9GAMM|nr:VOC family protein [Paraferrimonas haliotis]GLS82531.1 glyoxalase [Paraferrimonas haliotis]
MKAPINYIELPANDLVKIKRFFSDVFEWQFSDYGEQYTAFSSASAGLDGGFYLAPLSSSTEAGAALVVLFSDALEACLEQVVEHGGRVVKPIFEFPGGRRFHFCDPCGNEWAVWSLPEA